MRQYNYFGFDGSIALNPKSVEARGNGIKFYYTVDNSLTKPSHMFLRVDGIGIEIRLPADASDPNVWIKGYLAVKDTAPSETGESAISRTSYVGEIEFSFNKPGMKGGAGMIYTPDIPAFLVDVGLSLPSPIALGTTGLAIYDVGGLFGKQYVLNKSAAGLDEEARWYEFYRKEVPTAEGAKSGIVKEKFVQDQGFTAGLGAVIGTNGDQGKIFSARIMLLLSMPGVFVLEGQGKILGDRVPILGADEPPFSIFMSIDKRAIEIGAGVNYNLPESGNNKGVALKATGNLEMAYFFQDSSAWFINVGKNQPETERVQATILSLFNAWAYFMINAQGIRQGAGVSYNISKNYGPVKLNAGLYLSQQARISFSPVQLGGSLELGGFVNISLFKFNLAFDAYAILAAEVFKPFIVTGAFEINFKVLKKKYGIRLDFTWIINKDIDDAPIPLVKDASSFANAINMMSLESFNVYQSDSISNILTELGGDDYIIPLDSFIDIDLSKSVNSIVPVTTLAGKLRAPQSEEVVPPTKGKSDQVHHSFILTNMELKMHDGANWVDYDVYDAVSAIRSLPNIQTELGFDADYLKELPDAYWQLYDNKKNTKIRVMGQNMFSYLNQNSNGTIQLENFGIESKKLFCPQDEIAMKCINWENDANDTILNADTKYNYDNVTVKVIGENGTVKTISNSFGLNKGLKIDGEQGIELLFAEPVAKVNLKVSTVSPNVIGFSYYKLVDRIVDDVIQTDHNGLPTKVYELIRTDSIAYNNLASYAGYQYDNDNPYLVSKVRIITDKTGLNLSSVNQADFKVGYNSDVLRSGTFDGFIDDLVIYSRSLGYFEIFDKYFYDKQPANPLARWKFDGNANDSSSYGINGSLNNNPYSSKDRFDNPAHSFGFFQQTNTILPQYMSIPNDARLALEDMNFSIFAWVKFPNTEYNNPYKNWINYQTNSRVIASMMDNTNKVGYTLMVDSYPIYNSANPIFSPDFEQRITFEWWQDILGYKYYRYAMSEPITLDDGEWHHVGIVFDRVKNFYDFYFDKHSANIPGSYNKIGIPQSPYGDSTYLHEICILDRISLAINKNIPTNVQLSAEREKLMDATNGTFQPVWQPDTKYYIKISGYDNVNNQSSPTVQDYYVAFKTRGPIGHFHQTIPNDESTYLPSYKMLFDKNQEDKFRLASLKGYIDYNRSYPNADGNTLDAKPLFYNSQKLNLFYKYNTVNAMYSDWSDYTSTTKTSKLKLIIKDPLDISSPTPINPTWQETILSVVGSDLQLLGNLLTNGDGCNNFTGSFAQPNRNSEYDLGNLKPQKMYKALFIAEYEGKEAKVHEYVFQTSRYANFAEQINSFKLYEDTINQIFRNAIFNKDIAVDSADINIAKSIVDKSLSVDDELVLEFPDVFDRIIDGAIKVMNPMDAAISTEVNIVKDTTSGNIIGILVRSPEPFVAPKIPFETEFFDTELTSPSVNVKPFDLQVNNISPSGLKYLFSKDRSGLFITNDTMDLSSGDYKLTMNYIDFDGNEYIIPSGNSIDIDFTIN